MDAQKVLHKAYWREISIFSTLKGLCFDNWKLIEYAPRLFWVACLFVCLIWQHLETSILMDQLTKHFKK